MVFVFVEDPHFYLMFKENIMKHGTGKMVIHLYNDWESLKLAANAADVPGGLLLMQSITARDEVQNFRLIHLGVEDQFDEHGAATELSLCRSFKELIGRIANEMTTTNGKIMSLSCKTYYGICDDGVSRLSMLQRLSSMAVQYKRQMLIVDLDLGGEVSEEMKGYSDRAVYQLINGGKIQWGSLKSKEHLNIFYFKPFYQLSDTHLFDSDFIKNLKAAALEAGIEFIMALHKGSLSAPSHAFGRSFDVHFVMGASFERERLKIFEVAQTANITFFSNLPTKQHGDQLTEWHRYMNGEMRIEQGGIV